jgi:hypothetical protein
MTRIGLISDTHSFLDNAVFTHFKECDEIWHAGDFGDIALMQALENFKPLKAVYGNIDAVEIRWKAPEILQFTCEDVPVFMTHIGGYPGHYAPGIKKQLQTAKPKLFISGHSHILKIMYDESLQCLHMNAGAAGKSGWHKIRTLIRFAIDGDKIKDCEVIELGPR